MTQLDIDDFVTIQKKINKLQRESNKISLKFVETIITIGRTYMNNKNYYWMDDEDWWYDTDKNVFIYLVQDQDRTQTAKIEITTELLLSKDPNPDNCKEF